MEWTDKQKYNSFNSMKGLSYHENYKAIMRWMDGDAYLPPPIECNLDPFAECNLNCYFCVTQRYLRTNREEVGEMRTLPAEYLFRLVDFLADWGVRGLCISGGGEPTLHPDLPALIRYAHGKMDIAVVTNAVSMTSELIDALLLCRWVALSVDSADSVSYLEIKGRDRFLRVIDNISRLVARREITDSSVDLCFKMVLLPENMHSIYKACKLAKDLGVQDFHVRPVDFERTDIIGNQKLWFDKERVEYEFDRCHEEETESFHVYTVTHKFNPDFHVKHDFSRCLATPLVIPILQDGNAYVCVDRKMEEKFNLGSCYPNPGSILDWWGSDSHRDIIKGITPHFCSRCTWSQYNSQISETVLRDNMCLSFP